MAQKNTDNLFNVVILAGGVNTISLYEGYVPGPKALLPYEGKASIEYVLDALDAVPNIGQICIEGPREQLQKALSHRRGYDRLSFINGGATFLDSLIVGLKQFRSSRSVMFVTADLPLITPEAIREFITASSEPQDSGEQSVHVAAVPRKFYTGPYLKFTKPFNRFRDIHICHGNLFIVDTDLLDNQDLRKRVTRMYNGRKSILSRLAFGWKIALTYLIGVDLLHILTLRYMAEFASRFLGVKIVPVLIPHPEVTMDVDEPKDYRFVRAEIQKQVGHLAA
jgi:molybdopterin-guanine dinucleotide biosynthesis protein A